jgi:hypothetical protein
MICHYLCASFPTAEKKEENRKLDLKNKRELLNLWGIVSLSLLIHDKVKLDRVRGHIRPPAKS